ncbi:EEF1A lysine methyltransferase 2-like [Physella acuta]|uniref:EEF1A lysine methyltransferase 2-like n=1 Tax=Physella acuta TaxID=109671 RepID=UPI0027DB2814|nr:EEF1A lysine methyltransferase 2-like [Physella acuta]XP_059153828.1 EEF1A lysine methyltransferase 2-like [Physella acuta]XP_059153829.1 EEF1A lysine methyltransferase 2-like [Physella acuta]
MEENEAISDFGSSELGTQEYWDNAYSRELKSFDEIGDVGEIWFGEEAQHRVVNWIANKSGLPSTAKILDLGCGNGLLLLALTEENFTNLTGVDYSEGAIQLSKSIANKEGVTDINFLVCDLLSTSSVEDLSKQGPFDVCVDKGTYDAISLRQAHVVDDRRTYSCSVKSLLKEGGLFIITSCNWTSEQLKLNFQNEFELVHEIPAPKFTFGGKTGQTVTTLVFKLR